jgi:hypothetical protein
MMSTAVEAPTLPPVPATAVPEPARTSPVLSARAAVVSPSVDWWLVSVGRGDVPGIHEWLGHPSSNVNMARRGGGQTGLMVAKDPGVQHVAHSGLWIVRGPGCGVGGVCVVCI